MVAAMFTISRCRFKTFNLDQNRYFRCRDWQSRVHVRFENLQFRSSRHYVILERCTGPQCFAVGFTFYNQSMTQNLFHRQHAQRKWKNQWLAFPCDAAFKFRMWHIKSCWNTHRVSGREEVWVLKILQPRRWSPELQLQSGASTSAPAN